jgi:hypothetical protein
MKTKEAGRRKQYKGGGEGTVGEVGVRGRGVVGVRVNIREAGREVRIEVGGSR